MGVRSSVTVRGLLVAAVLITLILLVFNVKEIHRLHRSSDDVMTIQDAHITQLMDDRLKSLNDTLWQLVKWTNNFPRKQLNQKELQYNDNVVKYERSMARKIQISQVELRRSEVVTIQPETDVEQKSKYDEMSPIAWIIKDYKDQDMIHVRHIKRVLERLGYTVVMATWLTEWDLAWGWADDPFWDKLDVLFYDLKPHQKVNEFPGAQFVMKNRLVELLKFKPYIPKAFVMPMDKNSFIEYITKNPDKMWVKKDKKHKGVKIVKAKGNVKKCKDVKLTDINFTDPGSFLQEYIGNPLLVDERRFDFGLYTVVTSVNPLRVYILDEVNFRFCPEKYYPFNSSVVNKYVIKENYTPIWQMPSLKKLYSTNKYRTKTTMDTYFSSIGVNAVKLWQNVYDTVVDVMLDGEENIIKNSSRYGSSRNFFQLYRADFIMDKKSNFYLMEINMSPNLSPVGLPQLKPLFEHVLYNTFKLTGVARNTQTFLEKSSDDELDMMVSDKDITVFPQTCSSALCQNQCKVEICKVCLKCLSVDQRESMKYAFLEHINRGTYTRVFPPAMEQDDMLSWKPGKASLFYQSLNDQNKLMYMWFVGKCQQHRHWCS